MRHLIPTALTTGLLLCSVASAEKLTIWVVGDETSPKIIQPAVDLYRAAHPDVTFEVRAVPGDQAFTKYLAALASRSGPDIITGYLSYGIEIGKKGGLINLKQKYPALVASVAKTANKGIMNAITSIDGSLYALPYDVTVQLLYYRTDLVKSPPATWSDLTATMDKLRASGNKGMIQQWGNAGWVGYFPYFKQAGGSLYDAKCTQATINSAAGVTALNYYAQFYTKYKAPTDGWPDMEQGLENGDYALGMTGNWSLQSIRTGRPKLAGKWGIAAMPKGPAGNTTAFEGGSLIGIMSYTKVPDLAADFIKQMYTTRTTVAMIKAANDLGALWLPAGRQDLVRQANVPASLKTVLMKQLDASAGPPNCPGWEQSGDSVQKAIQQVIFNGQDAKAALDDAAKTMNANLSKYGN
ncbi:ABC-type glycerol-3-phosphate transport system substrate-binding protein [Deinococcus metalli]|uniref:ABC-type glycerol-3-phosphate transport system substrate-binding protein n=1 Tax=Deinococcus metalli TaxID=1141878 RepID=A0A7W8NPD3_9DEIO|nr:extracellular solute-binding protein [Deinococcus metalli]MBB5376671.1 ABC-type glycerol-3-phosphate transport system substrate-binding protein [Deinococcus metalli]GHF42348.1 sugar ABC transporter substrate-binding protein [Deinococcus metalli]